MPVLPTSPPEAPPPVTLQLRQKGPQTLGHETNLARAPLWGVRERTVQLAMPNVMLYHVPFRQKAGAPLTVADQRLLAELTTAYVRDGCPKDRRVTFSLTEAARILGLDSMGGRQRQLVRQSLARLCSVTLESATRLPDGSEAVLMWGLLDKAFIRQPRTGPGRGWAMLSEELAQLLRQGSVTYLHAPTWDAIAAQDEIAGRLWSFLEAEQLGRGYRYQLFAAAPGDISEQRNMPAITELLRLDWAVRRNAAARIQRACTVIARTDRRYQLTVVKGRASGMWRLDAHRSAFVGEGPRGPLPTAVVSAWRAAYMGKLPSKKQVSILQELVERRGPLWVAVRLSEKGDDPLGIVLAADSAQKVRDRGDIVARERAWEQEKRGYQEGRLGDGQNAPRVDGAQSIGSILRGLLPTPDATPD